MTKYDYLSSIWILPLVFTLTIAADFNLNCPTGWTKNYEKCYIVVPTLRSWVEADEYCQKYGARLVKPSGYIINDYVSTLFGNGDSAEYWIGYNILGSTNTERYSGFWSDESPTKVEVGVWGDFEPNTPIGSCARVDKSHDNKWYMESCDRLLPSVCELTPCPDDTFRCTMTGRCLGLSNICDGVDDCGDSSDERNCLTDCKYYITGTSGQITMPISGSSYPALSTCVWTIEAPVGKRIQVQFTTFETEQDLDVVEFWEGSPTLSDSHCLARLSGKSVEGYQVLFSSNNFLTVRFISDATVQESGFTFNWGTDFQCQITKLSTKRHTTGQLGDTRLLTQVQDYTVCEKQCSDEITCTGFSYNKADNNCFLLKEVALPVDDNCCDLYVKTCPTTTGYPVRDDIPSLGGTVYGTTYDQYIYSPLYPIHYPGNLETMWVIQSSGTVIITLEVKDIELCGSDSVVIKDGDNPITPTLMTLTSSSMAGEIIMSTGNRMYVYMKLKEHLKCRGVLLSYKAGVEACNFNIQSNTGTIFSPGYGVVNYPGALECFWAISSVHGRPLRLTFTDYEVENGKDFVQAWVGIDDKGTPIHTGNGYSGSTPPPLISNTGKLAIKFITSAVGNHKGFTAVYTTGCELLSDTSYTITPGRTSVISGDVLTVSCNTGYTFQAPYAGKINVELTCQSDGEYDKTVPECSQAFCGTVPAINNGYVVSSTTIYGAGQVVYACNPGYSPPQGTDLSITCQSNSLWETPPSCTASLCSDPPLAITSGRREIVHGNGTSHESIISFACDQNYQLIGSSRILCANGTWSFNVPSCQQIRCPPQHITNGTAVFTGVLYRGNDVTVSCNTGFEVTGSNPYKCGIQNASTCQDIDECTAGTATCNQNCVNIIGGYYCTCNSGYRISATNPTVCEDIDECAYINGKCDHSCLDVDGSYNCTCNYGYDLYTYNGFQGLTLQAGEDGNSPSDTYHIGHSCVLKQCPTPDQTISHGRSLSLQLIFTQGDSVQYLCDVGYVIAGSNSATMTISCQGDGTWNPAIPSCTIATCFLDVSADSNTTPVTNINYGSIYQLICDSTNSTGVTLTRYCAYKPITKRYGTVGDGLHCPARSCGTPPAVSGSNTYSYSCTNYGCSFILSCAGSYQLAGSSSSGDAVVRCGVDGRWDLGDLRCISALCTDPGTPPDATQVAVSYEIGSLVFYQCKRAGYGPQPIYPIQCLNIGNTARWNVTYVGDDPIIPTCVDKTAPIFINCPTQDFTVELYRAPNHAIPTATDQSGFVRSIVSRPVGYRPTHVAPSTMTVTYTAIDDNGNTGTCSFKVNVKDQIPPSITCKRSVAYNNITENSTLNVDPLSFVDTVENGATVTANSPSFVLTKSDVGRVRQITLTAIDDAQNTASCTLQIYTTVSNKCQPWTISGANAFKSCVGKAGNAGYDCTFTCNTGYYFSNEVNTGSIVVSCFDNNDWNRKPPSCSARNPAYYRQSFVMRYVTGTLTEPSTCRTNYEAQLNIQWSTMASNLQTMCNTAQQAYNLTIVQPIDMTVARLGVEYSNGILYATFTFDMTPADYVDVAYTNCAQLISNAFINKQSQLNPIISLSAQGTCPTVSSVSVAYERTLKNYFVCTTHAGVQTINADSKSACFDCALGYYSVDKRQCIACGAGFYLSTGNRDGCDACPVGTNSQKTGLTRQLDCFLSCPKGMTSTNGEAPCNQCGLDSYSSNGLSCTSCGGLKTKGVGKTTASDCISSCAAGYYSYNGLEICRACPKNFYQAQTGQRQCLECGGNQVTQSEGKTSPADCIDGFASVCTNRCLHGGTCTVVNHDYFCSCPNGYTGPTCENTVNPCDIQPCYNGGQCTPNGLTYTCTCTSSRFSGDRCETDIDDCAFANNFNPCNNGSCHDLVGGYTCLCPSFSGFTGSTCTTPRDPCADEPCDNNGQCTAYGSIRRKCVCTPGYTGNSCELNIDECASSPCVNGGTCVDGVNGFSCNCKVGFSGVFCHVRGLSNVCTGSCGSLQSCVDYYPDDKPYCICPNGYNDNGNNCELSNYCDATSCLNSGTCISSYGGYICKCMAGYAGPSCQFTIDNCSSRPCLNSGTCQNAVNSFSCTCTVTGTGGTLCEDNKDNCDPYPCVIPNTIQCHDRINDYYCQCKPGFRGTNCTEGADDCNSFPCQHDGTCAATSTGYKCTCATGWFGNNCENSVNNCQPTSPCMNGGTCINTVSDYKCLCNPGYRGGNCDLSYDLCDLTSPCVGPNSTCTLKNGQPDCDCSSGYQGDSCNQKITACTSTSCLNGGTCTESGGTVTCSCVPGYTGSQCGTNINECVGSSCPTAASCIDGINTYTCQCNDGKVGSNCDKDLTYKFDIIVQPGLMCGDIEGISMSSVFGLGTTKLSVSLWVRFKTVDPKTILSLYALSSLTTTPELILKISNTGITGSINGNTYSLPYGTGNSLVTIQDGVWHHVIVTWNAMNTENPSTSTGRVLLYVDNSIKGSESNIGTSHQLATYGYLVVGGIYDTASRTVMTADGITGRISRLILAKEEFFYTSTISSLYNNIDYKPTSNVINTPIAYIVEKGHLMIDYQDEMTAGFCRTLATCLGRNSASNLPTVTCPGDQYVVSSERISSPTWTEATYGNTAADKVYYNINSGTAQTWGMSVVSSVGYDANNNAAVCVFRFYNIRGGCAAVAPSNPTGGSETCSSLSNSEGKRCTISCTQVDQQPSQPGPYYYTCNKYGMYGMAERVEPFIYPPCAAAVKKTVNVLLKLNYVNMTTSCESYKTALQQQIRASFTTVNSQWQRMLCNNVNCNTIPVSISCTSTTQANVEVLFNTLQDPLQTSQSVIRSPDEVVAIAVVDDKKLKYSQAAPVQSSMEITMVPSCIQGQQIVGNYCVSCAPGSYYSSNTAKCTPCPIGQYQSSSGQTACTSCPGGQTTYNTGAEASTLCYALCTAGMYYSLATSQCEFCAVGFYQPSPGSFHCLACGVGLTTAGLGTTRLTSCLDPSLITMTTEDPDAGQSIIPENGGLSGAEIAAIVLSILILLLLLLLLFFCCCRDRLPCFGKGVVEPEDKTPFKYVNRYGETDLHFTSYKLNDIREKRGIRPLDRKPRYDYSGEDTRSVHTDISVQVPVFLEKLDGSVSNRKTYYSNNTARSLVSDQDLEVEKPKKKKRNKKGKKKRRVPRTTEYDQNVDDEHIYEDLPTSTPRAMPPSYTSLPKSLKPLPKRFKTPSEASFATNSTYVRSRTDQSNSGGFSSGEYRKSKKEHAIKIDSDNEDLR